MARNAALILAALLSACGTEATPTRELADVADVNSRNALTRVSELESKVSELETELKQQSRLLGATGESLKEARENHDALLKTFNSNVEKSNGRDAANEQDIDWLLRRNGVFRNR